ncbi:RagB/SusD family nutrient uptake outer membrane protein [Arachidicoccus terrestris]|uniref:RagB/SusD family nutrient uptake outer membrane protein n=1 Tax=Arachidicoccus terrestris TaxID=2875539 RepID=UPI001CC711AC|nr:RagB/SusD family nutrient uptake outer membrane protein [Arachidicoccus terrestris]UAY56446.1 RagB/SusD family nutrient uptake outer membrane protein [Arachidicoccus terrestris]
MRFSKTLLCALLLLFVLGACNKKLDVDTNAMANENTQWKTMDDTRSNLIGVYALFRAALANNNDYWLWGELRHGDFVSTTRADLKAVIDGDLNASYKTLDDMKDWRRFYAVINAANLFIERSGEALVDPRYTTLNHDVDVAQVRSLRAWAYFMMVRIWGDVPFITNSYDGSFPAIGKSSQGKVLSFCEQELLAAAQVLPFQYGVLDDPILPGLYYTYGLSRFENTLISRTAAYALLAHVAAWQGHYADVDVYAKFVIDNYSNSHLYYLTTSDLTDPDGVFYARGNYNQLLGFNFVYGHGETGTSGVGHIESWTLAAPLITKPKPDMYVPVDVINAAFTDRGDQRFGIDTVNGLPRTAYFTNYNAEIPIFSKIKVLGDGGTDGEFAIYSSAIIFSRLEEITLLKAEADAVLGKSIGVDGAITLLDIIRTKRGESPYEATVDGPLIDAIFAERRRELMGEGWRWYDQIRYNKITRKDPEMTKLIDEGGIYWPIAASVLSANEKLTQNAYWNVVK